jgi:methylenetetrahydrofolate reductase (NADPH)
VSALPTRPVQDAIEEVASWRAAGFEPVPHLAVRNFATARELDDFLARVGEAGVRRVLVIAGDRDQPSGDFRSSIEVIDGGALQRHGIVEIGIAGYPDGHPRISEQDLERSLAEKIHVAETTGMAVHIVTQFCFDAPTVLKWIGRLRDFGVEHPVRVGLPGPTNLATLLRYARRCGVRASAQGLARQAGLVRQLFAMSTPDVLVRAIAEGACSQASRRDRAAFLLLRRTGASGTVGRGGGGAPHCARAFGRIPGRAAAPESVMRRLDLRITWLEWESTRLCRGASRHGISFGSSWRSIGAARSPSFHRRYRRRVHGLLTLQTGPGERSRRVRLECRAADGPEG